MLGRYLFITALNLFLASTITYLSVPLVDKIGKNFGFVDIPNERKLKKESLTRIGGLAMILGFISVILINYLWFSETLNEEISIFPVLLLCTIFVFIIGLIDDKNNISPWPRLSFQFIISSIIWSQGVSIDCLNFGFLFNNFGYVEIPYFLSFLFTIFWITAVINAVNWIDGLDGLATGISIICSFTFLIKSFIAFEPGMILLSSAILGSCLGFLKYNFFPSEIFMGDCGSYFLGFNLAVLSIIGSTTNLEVINNSIPSKIFNVPMSLLFLFIPIADMTVVIFSRILNGKSPFLPDNRHLHHRLLLIGCNQKSTVIIIYSFAILASILGFVFI